MRNGSKKGAAVRQYVRSTTPRMRWTAELHRGFLQAIESLGGLHIATPKLILQRMGAVEGLTIAHVKSHLQMHRGHRPDEGMKLGDRWMKEMQPQLQRKHSCAADEQGPNSFLCPPLKRTRMETGATYKGMQGSEGISEMMRTCGTQQYCIDDYYYMQTMAMERGIKEEGLRWQRDAAAASNLQTVGCLEQWSESSDTFKITRPLGAPQLGVVAAKQQGYKENDGDVCFLLSSEATRDGPEQCSLSLSLGSDPKGVPAVAAASSPSEGSCILSSSSSRRSSSDSSGHSGCFVTPDLNLELAMSISGSY